MVASELAALRQLGFGSIVDILPGQVFQVGIFCDKFVTPVSQGYSKYLEQIRG